MAIHGEQTEAEALEHIPGWGHGRGAAILFGIAIAFSAFQLWTAAYSPLPSQVIRSVHVGFLLLLLFGLIANGRQDKQGRSIWWCLAIGSFIVGLYHWWFYADLILRSGLPNELDIAVGVVAIALVFLAGYKMMGASLPIICGAFVLYGMFGQYLPSPLNHRGFDFEQIVDILFLGTEGIYGTPIYVSSSYIFLFILFGSFLERAGMIQLFNDIAIGTVGHTQGGPGKVAVISSALMGTINGSGVANVVTTGAFTIPLMKKFGFRPVFAGAVEATASMGGQIMPPVMGAVAFIMAETLGVPYSTIVHAAIIPAILYFGTAFWVVHLEAGKQGLIGLRKEDCPNALRAILDKWYLLLPLAALVWLLFSGYTPLFAGTVGLGLTALIVLGMPLGMKLHPALRTLFWVALGLCSAAAFQTQTDILGIKLQGVTVILLLVLLLVLVNFVVRGGRSTLRLCLESLGEGAKNALPVGVACALVGTLIGVLALTGSATTFARVIVAVGESSLFLSLILTMIACIILGTGIPTIPNYIITASIAGPALLQLGVPLIVSHMFVFYFGIMADLTPPVALAAFAAAPIAKADGSKIGWEATRIATAGFVVPFMAVYAPEIMLQMGGSLAQAIGFWPAVVYSVTKTVVAIGLWGLTAVGHCLVPLRWWERLYAFAAACFLVATVPISDEIGWVASALLIGWIVRRAKREREPVVALG